MVHGLLVLLAIAGGPPGEPRVQYSFSQGGVYTIKPYQEWDTGFGPFRITVGNGAAH